RSECRFVLGCCACRTNPPDRLIIEGGLVRADLGVHVDPGDARGFPVHRDSFLAVSPAHGTGLGAGVWQIARVGQSGCAASSAPVNAVLRNHECFRQRAIGQASSTPHTERSGAALQRAMHRGATMIRLWYWACASSLVLAACGKTSAPKQERTLQGMPEPKVLPAEGEGQATKPRVGGEPGTPVE